MDVYVVFFHQNFTLYSACGHFHTYLSTGGFHLYLSIGCFRPYSLLNICTPKVGYSSVKSCSCCHIIVSNWPYFVVEFHLHCSPLLLLSTLTNKNCFIHVNIVWTITNVNSFRTITYALGGRRPAASEARLAYKNSRARTPVFIIVVVKVWHAEVTAKRKHWKLLIN